MTASCAATDTAPPIGRRGERRVVAIRETGDSATRPHLADGRLYKSVVRYRSRPTRLPRRCPPARRLGGLGDARGFVQLGISLSQHDPDCWLDRGVVPGGLLLCDTTHAPFAWEVEQILSNLVPLFA